MKELIELIKSFGYTHPEMVKYEELIQEHLKGFPISQIKIEKGRVIYRCRKYSLPVSSAFGFESDLSYRTDISNIQSYGRCNIPFNSVFYGSFVHYGNGGDKEADLTQHGYLTSIFETTSLLDDPSNGNVAEGVEVYGVGMWEAKEDFYLCLMPPDKVHHEGSELAKRLLDVHAGNMEQASASDEVREIYSLLGSEYSKYMHGKPNVLYFLTALFSSHLIDSTGGLAFASVKTEQKGFNVALSPHTVDTKLNFVRAGIGELWKFNKEMHFRFLVNAERSDGLPLKYSGKDVSKVTFDDMLTHYGERGVSSDHIAKVLLKNNYKI